MYPTIDITAVVLMYADRAWYLRAYRTHTITYYYQIELDLELNYKTSHYWLDGSS